MIEDVLAAAPLLRRLELRPMYADTNICSSADSGASKAAFRRVLDTSTLQGLSALAFDSLPPALAMSLVQHSNLRQLSILELRDVRWAPRLIDRALDTAPSRGPSGRSIASKGGGPTPQQLLAAIGSNMRQLRELDISRTERMELSPVAFGQLAAALPQLTALDVWGCPWLFNAAAEAAAAPDVSDEDVVTMLKQLRSLKVNRTSSRLLSVAAISQATALTHLVAGGDWDAERHCPGLGHDRGAEQLRQSAWAHLSRLTALESLNVTGCSSNAEFDAGLLLPLVEACGSRLRVLLLDACVKQQGELAELLPACTGLTALNLSHSSCSFSADDLSALAGLSRLAKLQLHRCKPMLRDDVVAALVQLRQLQQLDLRDNDLSLAGARALLVALAGAGGQLTELRMGGNFDVTGRAKVQLAREFVHVAL
ncbi:hypothetical protein OEZ86_000856 [Tetradesmus obliquus]|nr:hypothetical protein OEZ86_000856 [Tetradesmus obliquus]